MSNAIGTSVPVMINRIALREGASLNSQLAKVAELRMELSAAEVEASGDASAERRPAVATNGAEVDRLI